ncbi:MAG TPA: heavy-metal-associated domain-containing protein [Steroidobacteraceae bacterium]|nr:heavy-metal-associated domain-containing protein [Steroidobacteraceae bacterium]
MKRFQLLLAMTLFTLATGSMAATIEMTVNGLVCAFCAQGIEKKLRKFPATAEVVVNLEHRLVAVSLKDGQDIPDADLRRALTESGYTVKAISRSETPIADVRERLKQAQP